MNQFLTQQEKPLEQEAYTITYASKKFAEVVALPILLLNTWDRPQQMSQAENVAQR